jgi:hypothetical protein
MAKINLEQYPELKEQADYILKLEGLAEKLSEKVGLLKNVKYEDKLKEVSRKISIDKNEIELQAVNREIDEKKKEVRSLNRSIKGCFKRYGVKI